MIRDSFLAIKHASLNLETQKVELIQKVENLETINAELIHEVEQLKVRTEI